MAGGDNPGREIVLCIAEYFLKCNPLNSFKRKCRGKGKCELGTENKG
jgi:hypothetical protein